MGTGFRGTSAWFVHERVYPYITESYFKNYLEKEEKYFIILNITKTVKCKTLDI